MLTPAERHLFSRAWAWMKQGFELARRVATLEARVTALEEAQGKQLPDACPNCGERAMRRTHVSHIFGSAPNQWRQDGWTCEKCGNSETRIVRFP